MLLELKLKCEISWIEKKLKKTRKPTFHSPLNQCFSPIHFFNFDTIFPATRLDSILLGFEAGFACKEPFRPKRVIIPCQEQMRSLSFMPEPFSWQRILRNYPCRLPLRYHPRFFDQGRHQTTSSYIEKKHFSLNDVIVRPTKIMNRVDKNWTRS